MNMGKLGRPLAWCFLAVLFPLAAHAAPKIELTAYVTDVTGYPDVIEIAVVEGEPWEVHIDAFTEVGFDLSTALGASVNIEGVLGDGNIVALEIHAGDPGINQFEGIVTGVDGTGERNITVIGYHIPVPDEAEIKDIFGDPLDFSALGGRTVRVEGDTVAGEFGDYFSINEIAEIADFSCSNNSDHAFEAAKPADDTSKSTEHYCLNLGKKTGLTEISHTDFTGTDVSSYTIGKYRDGDRHGFWLTIDVTGTIIQRCLYNNGNLVDGDLSCAA